MVSVDRRQWDTRSTRSLRDFVVDPRDPDTVLATDPGGLLRSTDGGRTWDSVATAPGLAVLAWVSPQALYGAGPAGSVYQSRDGGAS